MKPLAVLALLTLAACDTGPYLGAGVGIGPGGVYVSPSVSGRVGGVGVAVSP